MKRVTASLYNFLDEKQSGIIIYLYIRFLSKFIKGKVSFEDLLRKMYPTLEKDHMYIINRWIK